MAHTQQTTALFKPIKVGRLELQQRVVLAPMTRLRAYANHVPGPQSVAYYSQRSSTPGSFLITEATLISQAAGGIPHATGVYTDAQVETWKKISEAVHAKGSYIFLQLWTLGRAADTKILEKHDPPSPYVAPSPIALKGRSETPRALTEAEIQEYIAAYAKAASNAVHGAGFDGVEIHAANGFLIDQFLQTNSNTRTDKWGGDEEGRTRFAREIVDAVVDVVGADRVGMRISPWNPFQDMRMPDPEPTFAYLVTALRDKHPKMAYLHVIESRVAGSMDRDSTEGESNDFLREIWNSGEGGAERAYISAGGHTRETALHTVEKKGGLVAFGRKYVANPDLPNRLEEDIALTPSDRSKYYLAGNLTPFGYTDWPFADGTVREIEQQA